LALRPFLYKETREKGKNGVILIRKTQNGELYTAKLKSSIILVLI
jgi:hypothetical protein